MCSNTSHQYTFSLGNGGAVANLSSIFNVIYICTCIFQRKIKGFGFHSTQRWNVWSLFAKPIKMATSCRCIRIWMSDFDITLIVAACMQNNHTHGFFAYLFNELRERKMTYYNSQRVSHTHMIIHFKIMFIALKLLYTNNRTISAIWCMEHAIEKKPAHVHKIGFWWVEYVSVLTHQAMPYSKSI